jgi:prolyl-tRNA editing enzyme YbaK/EbsC (Cys-tRNA(Pro) deacylase)
MADTLQFAPALNHPELLAASTRTAIERATNPSDVLVAEIDPAAAAAEVLMERYGVLPTEGVNCVIIEAVRSGISTYAAVLVQPGTRADLNGIVRKHLGARRVSFAPHDLTLEMTGMEYGSITAIGLPADWPVLISAPIMLSSRIIMGSGLVKSKLSLTPRALVELTGGEVLEIAKS